MYIFTDSGTYSVSMRVIVRVSVCAHIKVICKKQRISLYLICYDTS